MESLLLTVQAALAIWWVTEADWWIFWRLVRVSLESAEEKEGYGSTPLVVRKRRVWRAFAKMTGRLAGGGTW